MNAHKNEFLAIGIFCLTYVLISGRQVRILPVDRPAAALLGSVLMVACATGGIRSPGRGLTA